MGPWFGVALAPLLAACTAAPAAVSQAAAARVSILAASSPAEGASVDSAIGELRLRFDPPARLIEVTVTDGAGQTMPMMVTAVGEVAEYRLPLGELDPGPHRVVWRATIAGVEHRGSFAFTAR